MTTENLLPGDIESHEIDHISHIASISALGPRDRHLSASPSLYLVEISRRKRERTLALMKMKRHHRNVRSSSNAICPAHFIRPFSPHLPTSSDSPHRQQRSRILTSGKPSASVKCISDTRSSLRRVPAPVPIPGRCCQKASPADHSGRRFASALR